MDTYTGKVRVIEYVQAIDCGTVINPVTARGQALGGVVNAISFAVPGRALVPPGTAEGALSLTEPL